MRRPRIAPDRSLSLLALGLCTLGLGACGDTLQDQSVSHSSLESLLLAPYPVYWLGGSFQHMAITQAFEDPGGAFTIQYGDCSAGGQSTCVPRLRIVSSPDNSFIPAGSQPHNSVRIRGVSAVAAQGGDTIEIPTAGVVVGIYADRTGVASSAAETAVPINEIGAPGSSLPPPLADSGFGGRPLPGQTPIPLRTPR